MSRWLNESILFDVFVRSPQSYCTFRRTSEQERKRFGFILGTHESIDRTFSTPFHRHPILSRFFAFVVVHLPLSLALSGQKHFFPFYLFSFLILLYLFYFCNLFRTVAGWFYVERLGKSARCCVCRLPMSPGWLCLYMDVSVCESECECVFSMASPMNGNKAVWLLHISNLHILWVRCFFFTTSLTHYVPFGVTFRTFFTLDSHHRLNYGFYFDYMYVNI